MLFSNVININCQTPISQSSRNISSLVDKRLFVHQEDGSEVFVGVHHSQLITIDKTLFINTQSIVSIFKQRIKSVKNAWVAQVCILEHNPLSLLD
jgi:hypothetical protein